MNGLGAPTHPAIVADSSASRRGGARALMLTVLGEFVLRGDGAAWTSTLIAAADTLGIGEKNARQAIARIGEQGLIEAVRHGRETRWTLTDVGRRLLETGARRIYEFGTVAVDWRGDWLVAYCQVAESQRAVRHRLRTQLAFLGFGELSASLLVTPHVGREPELRRVLDALGLSAESVVLRSTTGSIAESAELVARAWDVDALADSYVAFSGRHRHRSPSSPQDAFRAVVGLVHDWRRFPSVDPELPTELLPDEWAGSIATEVFRERHREWSPAAQDWFADRASQRRRAS